MADKGFNLFDERAARLYLCPLRKKSAPHLPEGTVEYIHIYSIIAPLLFI